MKYIILLNILLCLGVNSTAQEKSADENPFETEMIFTPQDKDYLQLWHYEQVLKMQLNQEEIDNYLSLLNYYTYKMSRLGLKKYGYTDAERKVKFDDLVDHLSADMKDLLNPNDYEVHKESFKKIEKLVYDKRNWDELKFHCQKYNSFTFINIYHIFPECKIHYIYKINQQSSTST